MADYTVALIGNPNVGKSTLFNRLTGLRQHTGNWPGKTVEQARGQYEYRGRRYRLVDLPGTYSLASRSKEETVTAAFLKDSAPDCVLVLCDATCLERNLILVLQLRAITRRLVVGVNLLDEAARRGIEVDLARLEQLVEVPVRGIVAGDGTGVDALQAQIRSTCDGFSVAAPSEPEPPRQLAARAEEIARRCVRGGERPRWERRLDRFLTRPLTGSLAVGLLLLLSLYLTVCLAQVPSAALEAAFGMLGQQLTRIPLPDWLGGLLWEGLYGTVSRVVAVMLPPMAIFFVLFTLLEDAGLLPRLAFLLDRPLQRCGGEGRMALTMCMGLGCNAAGVTGCRIIASKPEQRLAMITNALIPCNGRLPALIMLSGLLVGGGLARAAVLAGCLGLAVAVTFLSGRLLRVGRDRQSAFLLELPPYRKPRIGQVLVRAALDRTLFVLGRAVLIAAPAGVVIWGLSRSGLLPRLAAGLEPAAAFLGLSGPLLLAFFLALPAAELVLPVAVLIAGQGSVLFPTWQSALCAMVFFMFHWPCGTTVATVWKESRSGKTVLAAVLLPTLWGCVLCAGLRILLT